MAYVPCTGFEGDTEEAKWNGWENGPGASKGELKTEGSNGYWSGQVNVHNIEKVLPALRKVFDAEPGTGLKFHFRYRILSAPSDFFYITITEPNRWVMNFIAVETTTPVGRWLETEERSQTLTANKEIWIGLSRSHELAPIAVEFDNICFEITT